MKENIDGIAFSAKKQRKISDNCAHLRGNRRMSRAKLRWTFQPAPANDRPRRTSARREPGADSFRRQMRRSHTGRVSRKVPCAAPAQDRGGPKKAGQPPACAGGCPGRGSLRETRGAGPAAGEGPPGEGRGRPLIPAAGAPRWSASPPGGCTALGWQCPAPRKPEPPPAPARG